MDITQRIVEHLTSKYQPKAILLHGSRATGKHRPNSDWDLYVFVETDQDGWPELFEGQSLDVHVVHVPLDGYDFIDLFGSTLLNAKILLDSDDGFARRLLEEAQDVYIQGRTLTEKEFQNRRTYLYRNLQRLEGTVDKPMEFFYRLGDFYQCAIRYWFETRGKWSKPVYDAIAEIQTEDPEYFSWIKGLSANRSEPEKAFAARKIFERLFHP